MIIDKNNNKKMIKSIQIELENKYMIQFKTFKYINGIRN